jgi:hypothetical protein
MLGGGQWKKACVRTKKGKGKRRKIVSRYGVFPLEERGASPG